jgi:hypothetical protein
LRHGHAELCAATHIRRRAVAAFWRQTKERIAMLFTLAVILIILWALGLLTSFTMGGLIHVLLVIAIVVVLLRVISGRSPI